MERSTIVRVHDGLHARPATRFVKLAKSFESDIELVKDDRSVSAKSSVKLMLLGVKENEEITVRATGADAIEAIEALIGYLENPHAGIEDDGAVQPPKPDAGKPAQSSSVPCVAIIGPQIANGTISPAMALPALFAYNTQVGCDFVPVGLALGEAKPKTIEIGVPAVLISRQIMGPVSVLIAWVVSLIVF